MILWVRELELKLNKGEAPVYRRLKALREEKFQGNIRINFSEGKIVSVNIYETTKM